MKKIIVLALLFILLCAPAFSSSVREYLPSNVKVSTLPVDSVIGQLADPDSSEAHELLGRALASEYSFEWTETYIREDVRQSLVSLFGSWLSEHLQAGQILLSISHTNSDGSVGLNARVGDSCMSFIIDGGFIVSMKLISEDKSEKSN